MSGKIRLGPYILGETIGVGSFGKVKLAVHELTGHKVAVKILNRKKIACMDMIGKIRREIHYLKLLRHPHIIRLYEVITTPTDLFLIIEYVSGGELFDYIVKHGRLSEEEARKFFQQIISAVEYCHRHKIVHRDLKPENLLLDTNNNVRIADFGLSNIMMDGELLKTSCGSPNYAAPEVISGKYYAGPEVDVWSCGVILYALLCGRLPFDDEYIPSLFKKIKGGVYSIPSSISVGARELIQAMLTIDPLKRITVHEIMHDKWFTVNLPSYLKPLPEIDERPQKEFDHRVVDELCKKLKMDREIVVSHLLDPTDNHLKVAYNLVNDYLGAGSSFYSISDSKAVQDYLLASSPPSWTDSDVDTIMLDSMNLEARRTSSISILSTSLKKHVELETSLELDSGGKKVRRSRWHLGIRSPSRPEDIMNEVYRALKSLNMKWKIYNRYHVCCCHQIDAHSIKIHLQLYKVDQRYYLLDFRNIVKENGEMSAFDFLQSCHLIISELASNSQSEK